MRDSKERRHLVRRNRDAVRRAEITGREEDRRMADQTAMDLFEFDHPNLWKFEVGFAVLILAAFVAFLTWVWWSS